MSARTENERKGAASRAGRFLIGQDLQVNRLGFGAMRITGAGVWGPPASRTEAIRILRRAVELGINRLNECMLQYNVKKCSDKAGVIPMAE